MAQVWHIGGVLETIIYIVYTSQVLPTSIYYIYNNIYIHIYVKPPLTQLPRLEAYLIVKHTYIAYQCTTGQSIIIRTKGSNKYHTGLHSYTIPLTTILYTMNTNTQYPLTNNVNTYQALLQLKLGLNIRLNLSKSIQKHHRKVCIIIQIGLDKQENIGYKDGKSTREIPSSPHLHHTTKNHIKIPQSSSQEQQIRGTILYILHRTI